MKDNSLVRQVETDYEVGKTKNTSSGNGKIVEKIFSNCLTVCGMLLMFFTPHFSQTKFENKKIESIQITFEGKDNDPSANDQFHLLAKREVGEIYSTVKIRNALEKLYETKRVVSARVEAAERSLDKVFLRFVIKRKAIARKVSVKVSKAVGETVTEEELLFRLNLLSPGSVISERFLEENANVILSYLRDRGFYDAEVRYEQKPVGNNIEVEVVFFVKPNTQAVVGKFEFNIDKFDKSEIGETLKLKPGSLFSQEKLLEDIETVRNSLREQDYLAPRLVDPRIIYDSEKNVVDLNLSGNVGAKVKVTIDSEKEKINEKTQTRLLPVRREGTIDYSAIVEGERRLENHYQERGYFFTNVTPYCSVTPPFKPDEASATENDTRDLCTVLSGTNLDEREVEVRYEIDLNRRLKLVDIRLEGTDKIKTEEIQSILESQVANAAGIIPFLGYGHGYTSLDLLGKDRETIKSLLRELGYRKSSVRLKQGVSLKGDDLIITFVISEKIPAIIEDVEIVGNISFSDAALRAELPSLVGKKFSRARARNGVKKLSEFYSKRGYFDAKVTYSTTELPADDDISEEKIKITYQLENEGKKVVVNRVLINGNDNTKLEAVFKAIDIKPNSSLRLADIFTSEQNLYATDAFESVEIKPEAAGETPDGKNRQTDVIINLEEKKPRLITYGGGYSTDFGFSGFFDVRHFNLFRNLQQGGVQARWSQRQQLVQVDFLNPRFIPNGKNKEGRKVYAPITFTAQYQRDSTVTRFFRSTFDRGTSGVVQRISENGRPIDEFGNAAGNPTINRSTVLAETNRTISRKDRSILFVRYRFEDVRLFNFESLLIADLLQPDSRVRTSGLGATFVRDTRKNCSIKNTLLEIIEKGEPGNPCRYNASNPESGDYLTAEYNVSLPVLGANIGFNKFQFSYIRYYTPSILRNTTLAARVVLGLANVFSPGQRVSPAEFPGFSELLPISERFFAGGSTTLRGFSFEEAGPRFAVSPEGSFRNQNGEIVTVNPFTVPFGGNALAIVNLEARILLTDSFRIVPFYDGGNVFSRVGDIFSPGNPAQDDVFNNNMRALWTHTIGLGFRIKTPIGGEFAVDYGYLLNPPEFIIPQPIPPNGIFRLNPGKIHFRFSQAF